MSQNDLDIALLRHRLSSRVVGRQIRYHDVIGSTMDEARRIANSGAPEGVVVVAEEQTKGRGRLARTWISPRGQNLSLSALLRPGMDQLHYMNMAATLAVCRAVETVTDLEPAIKWPNDVRVNGRKLSGILVEAELEAEQVTQAVVGIGLNVNFDPSRFPEIADTATSIFRETHESTDRTGVLLCLLEEFDELYAAVKLGRSLTEDWAAKLETLGRDVRIRSGGRMVEGRAKAVDERGNLVLARSDGSSFTAVAGEVTLQV